MAVLIWRALLWHIHSLPEQRRRQGARNHFSLQLYKVPGYKSLYLTPVSRLVLWVLYITGAVVECNLELCACVLTCLLTQAEIVMLEVCADIKTKGRADEEHVNESPQQALSDTI